MKVKLIITCEKEGSPDDIEMWQEAVEEGDMQLIMEEFYPERDGNLQLLVGAEATG